MPVVLAAAVLVVATAALLFPGFGVVRAVEGLILLVLPGLALAWAALLAVDRRDPGVRILAAGLSLVLIPLGGLLMNLLPLSLGKFSWLGAGAVVLGIAWLSPAGRAFRLRALPRLPTPRPWPLATYAAATVLLLATIWIARNRADPFDEHFTQLWLVPTTQGEDVVVGVRNLEGATTTYRIDVTADGGVIQSWPDVVVPTGTAWTATLTGSPATGIVLEARVYLVGGSPEPYRTATLSGP